MSQRLEVLLQANWYTQIMTHVYQKGSLIHVPAEAVIHEARVLLGMNKGVKGV